MLLIHSEAAVLYLHSEAAVLLIHSEAAVLHTHSEADELHTYIARRSRELFTHDYWRDQADYKRIERWEQLRFTSVFFGENS